MVQVKLRVWHPPICLLGGVDGGELAVVDAGEGADASGADDAASGAAASEEGGAI